MGVYTSISCVHAKCRLTETVGMGVLSKGKVVGVKAGLSVQSGML